MLVVYFGLFICACAAQSVFYDSFTGNTVTNEEVKGHIKRNSTFWCVNEVLPCNPLEGRRVDGSCNNLKYPNRGAPHTPMLRLLPPEYDKDFEPRRSKNGDPLPLPRKLRTSLLQEGSVPDTEITQLLLHFFVFMVSDVMSVHDTVNYIQWRPYCCQEKGKTDNVCIPITITDDDPVHRFSSIRCMNLTRPESFQSRGCLRNNTSPERITTATSVFDLSHVYGNNMQVLNAKARLFEKGLLKFEVSGGKIWPPSVNTTKHLCFLNQLPKETRCHDIPEQGANSVLGVNLYLIWTWRLHNRVATELSKLNPCWDDDRIFFQTRDIVIAIIMQIFYYELMPAMMGYENLLRDGVLSPYKGFRDLYDENIIPQVSLEFPFALRWAHTFQEGNLKMYNTNGTFLKETKVVNLTLRTGYLDENIEYITHGAFRQPSAKFDYTVDPDIAETVLGPHQLASDVFSSDLTKNRYFGFPPYVKYRKYCSGKSHRNFGDLMDVIDPERITLLKERYKDVEDIDLMAGMWLEELVPGGRCPYTFYCLVVEQMIRSMVSDRHWYERPNRPNAFTIEQLLEIRKSSSAQMMCSVGDKVTHIQPQAFYMAGPGNEMRSCDEIEKINLWAWKDASCKPKNPLNCFNYNV
ncbi:jg6193 [Pararge aegeria aegeria]|uniref:Jg6193 protein n=1 Tax=Pararge aegeria aegeria TaxID=348720 RepID=A0A8S4S8X5_9NEOP|nr:jg6193 [Pararge aegeria aegeria]